MKAFGCRYIDGAACIGQVADPQTGSAIEGCVATSVREGVDGHTVVDAYNGNRRVIPKEHILLKVDKAVRSHDCNSVKSSGILSAVAADLGKIHVGENRPVIDLYGKI